LVRRRDEKRYVEEKGTSRELASYPQQNKPKKNIPNLSARWGKERYWGKKGETRLVMGGDYKKNDSEGGGRRNP